MASEPVRSTKVVAAPKDYSIPLAQQIQLLSVRAQFLDNDAGGNWLPALQILDNNGNVLVTAADKNVSVTAGASADVSWFPGVKPQAASSSTGAAISWAYISGNGASVNCPATSTTRLAADATTFYTNAPAMYDTHLSGGGVQGLRILQDGHYEFTMSAILRTLPSAGDQYQIFAEGGGELPDYTLAPNSIVFPTNGILATGSLETGGVFCVGGFIAPPTDAIVCRIDNGSAHAFHMEYAGLTVKQLDAVNQDLN